MELRGLNSGEYKKEEPERSALRSKLRVLFGFLVLCPLMNGYLGKPPQRVGDQSASGEGEVVREVVDAQQSSVVEPLGED